MRPISAEAAGKVVAPFDAAVPAPAAADQPGAVKAVAGQLGTFQPGSLDVLVGQAAAVRALRAAIRRPVHAYLFVGPPGSGKRLAAQCFAAMLLCPGGGEDGCATCRRVMAGAHPDVFVLEREGAAMTIDQAREVTRTAARTSVEGGPCVVVLPELHLARDAVPALLKTVEEPAGQTVFLALADFVPPELVTVASRCQLVTFRSLGDAEVADALRAEGVGVEVAEAAARAAGGRLDRARLLARDPSVAQRWEAWQSVPGRLDGSGATVAVLVDELLGLLKASAAPLLARQAAELEELAEASARDMPKVPGRMAQAVAKAGARELDERHKREQRRQRTDELRAGLAALAAAYRDRAGSGSMAPEHAARAVALVDGFSADLAYNPGEQLALQALLLRLEHLSG